MQQKMKNMKNTTEGSAVSKGGKGSLLIILQTLYSNLLSLFNRSKAMRMTDSEKSQIFEGQNGTERA